MFEASRLGLSPVSGLGLGPEAGLGPVAELGPEAELVVSLSLAGLSMFKFVLIFILLIAKLRAALSQRVCV